MWVSVNIYRSTYTSFEKVCDLCASQLLRKSDCINQDIHASSGCIPPKFQPRAPAIATVKRWSSQLNLLNIEESFLLPSLRPPSSIFVGINGKWFSLMYPYNVPYEWALLLLLPSLYPFPFLTGCSQHCKYFLGSLEPDFFQCKSEYNQSFRISSWMGMKPSKGFSESTSTFTPLTYLRMAQCQISLDSKNYYSLQIYSVYVYMHIYN